MSNLELAEFRSWIADYGLRNTGSRIGYGETLLADEPSHSVPSPTGEAEGERDRVRGRIVTGTSEAEARRLGYNRTLNKERRMPNLKVLPRNFGVWGFEFLVSCSRFDRYREVRLPQ